MRQFSKIASGIATSAIVIAAAGLATTGVAAADVESAPPQTCSQSTHATKNDASTVGITHTYDKTVSDASFATGTIVTYKIVVGTTGIGNPYVNFILDHPPVGFGAPVKSRVTAYHLGRGQVTDDVEAKPSEGGWSVNSTGWFVNSGNPVTWEVSYRVPDNLKTGDQVFSGGFATGGTVGVGTTRPGNSVCFTVRDPKPGEALLGSMDTGGVGSSDNQLSSTGSVTDIITGIVKNLIGS